MTPSYLYVGFEIAGLRIGASYDINISSLKAATTSRGGSGDLGDHIKKAESKGIPCLRFPNETGSIRFIFSAARGILPRP